MKTYESHFKAFAIPVSVVSVLIFNRYAYKLPMLLGLMTVVCVLFVLNKLIDCMPISKKEMTKNMRITLSVLAFLMIFLSFYIFEI